MARILVTGAAGFIGRAACPALAARGHQVAATTRRPGAVFPGIEGRALGEIGPATDWAPHLRGVDIVIHLAQRAHRRAAGTALAREPQTAAALARAAAAAGTRRLLYMSSIKAMGEATPPGRPFRAEDTPHPEDAYGRAKLATERALIEVARDSDIELVILRPPLVYGPGVRANFRALLRLAASGLPLPFAAIDNRRSLIFLDNLVDLAACVAVHPAAAGRVFLARDTRELSTPALVGLLAGALGRNARLFAVPPAMFAGLRHLPILGPPLARLSLSLQLDDSATRLALDWEPPVAAEAGIMATAGAFAARQA